MLLTKASEYALLAIVEFSKREDPVPAEKMASHLKLSQSFMAKILQTLAKDGILISYKGVKGGFALCDGYRNLSLKKIVDSAEKKPVLIFECSLKTECPSGTDNCQVLPVLQILQTKLNGFLEDLKISDLL